MVSSGERSEIAFFDVETTIPTRTGQGYSILEFGSILVCPKKLVELDSYSTLVRPTDLSRITSSSVRCNGITRDDVVSAPSFSEIADRVYDILHGRIWAGHNIIRFDCARIREAFAQIDRPAPEPKGTIDSLALLTQRFGRRAGDMKMATLATYFGLGRQTHRSLDDIRMNLEVLKYCATVLFLESSLPDIFTGNNSISPNVTTRCRSNGKASPEGAGLDKSSPSSIQIEIHATSPPTNHIIGGSDPISSLMTSSIREDVSNLAESNITPPDPFNMGSLRCEMEREFLQLDETTMESCSDLQNLSTLTSFDASSVCIDFLQPAEVHIPSITVLLAPFYRGVQRIQILHKDTLLQVCCNDLKVRFGISTKFVDYAGRPRLSFVVDASPDLCRVLEACDSLAQRTSLDSGSSSEWKPVVTRKAGFLNSPTIRLNLPTVADGNSGRSITEIYQKESSATRKLVFNRYEVAKLEGLLIPGTLVDAYFSLDSYDYQQNAGIRLVTKKVIMHSN